MQNTNLSHFEIFVLNAAPCLQLSAEYNQITLWKQSTHAGSPHLGDDDRANQLNVEYLRTSLFAHVCEDRRMCGNKSS